VSYDILNKQDLRMVVGPFIPNLVFLVVFSCWAQRITLFFSFWM